MTRGYTDLSGFTEEERKERRRQQKLQSKRKGKLPNIAPRLNYDDQNNQGLKQQKKRLVKKIKSAMSANGETMTEENFTARLRAMVMRKWDNGEPLTPAEDRTLATIKEEDLQKARLQEKKMNLYHKVNADAQATAQKVNADAQKTAQATLDKIEVQGGGKLVAAASKKQPAVRQSKKNPVASGQSKKKPAAGPSKKKTAAATGRGRARKENAIVPAPALFNLDDMVQMGEVGRILAACCISESKYPFAVDEIIGQLDWSNAALPLVQLLQKHDDSNVYLYKGVEFFPVGKQFEISSMIALI
ncbi:MAG: hypothetical protein SGARI_003472, partial [Bacillariaceae sp.]